MNRNSGESTVALLMGRLEGAESASLYEEMSFGDYLSLALRSPGVAYSAHQRMYQSILAHGSTPMKVGRDTIPHYKFFEDPFENGADAVFGLDDRLATYVDVIKAAASHLGQERRILIAHGPVGSSKSTLARLQRKGLVEFSKTDAGKLYTFSWYVDPNSAAQEIVERCLDLFGLTTAKFHSNSIACPMHDEPLLLLPRQTRMELLGTLNSVPIVDSTVKGGTRPPRDEEIVTLQGELCPVCRFIYRGLMKHYKGNLREILEKHIRVERLVFSEMDRIGIGSFRPKDEKNQDSTELSGDINYRKIAEYGAESDPRAFNFDGEFEVANRGFFYVEEILKLDKAFLYDFLGATQEHQIKPKRFAEIHIDEVLMAGTNNPEYEKLRADETMEAFRDRTTRIDIPYVLRLDDEIRIYRKVYTFTRGSRHIAPHTIDMASLWAITTRLEESARPGITPLIKAKLYAGERIGNMNEDMVMELFREHAGKEGMRGISPRYVQDKMASAFVADLYGNCLTPFAVFRELRDGLAANSLVPAGRQQEYAKLLEQVIEEYEDIIKTEVQAAIAGDEKETENLFAKYLDNVFAYVNKEKIRNPHTGNDEPPDERLMQSIEAKIGINERNRDEFRQKIVTLSASLQRNGKQFDFRSDPKLEEALRKKLFDDRKDYIKLTSLATGVVDKEEQKKIDALMERLRTQFGYCDYCANLVLTHVASIFARGDQKK